ncbi:MAG: NAD-dependent epimerase/dehydratase family protein [Acidobacteriota bacterium]
MTRLGHALVTGGAGFIGSHLARALVAGGSAVTVLDNLSTGRRDNVPDGARLIVGDVRSDADVRSALEGVDVVFHLAAQVTIRGSFDRCREDLETNLLGTVTLIRAIPKGQVRWLTLASSMAVYADAETPRPVPESHPTLPLSPYGVGKLAAERVAGLLLAELGVPLSVVRYFNTYGPGQAYTPYVGVMTIFTTELLRGAPFIRVFGDGEQTRDFTHVGDIVAGTLATVGRPPGTFNLGTGVGTTVNALARMLRDRLSPATGIRHVPAHPGELRYSIADITRAREALGYAPAHRLSDDVDDVVASVRERL